MKSINTSIQVRKLPDGWQAYREVNGTILVLDNFFEYEEDLDSVV